MHASEPITRRCLMMLALALVVTLVAWSALTTTSAQAQVASAPKAVDIPSRPGVTQRFLYIAPASTKGSIILMAGGHGGLQIFPGGSFGWGASNFLVRTRQLFACAGFAMAVMDAPSDKQSAPFLSGFRQTPEHVADVKAVMAWLKNAEQQAPGPVWLVGTSRGTQSAGFIAT